MPSVASATAKRRGPPTRPSSADTTARNSTVEPTGRERTSAIVAVAGDAVADGAGVAIGVGEGEPVGVGDGLGVTVGSGDGAGVGGGGVVMVTSPGAVT